MTDDARTRTVPSPISDCAAANCPEPLLPNSDPARVRAMTAGVDMRDDPAEWAFVRLSKLIADFEKDLDPDEEVGATVVGLPGDGTLKFDDVGFWAPDFILFSGKNSDGKMVRVIQHYSAINVTLSATKKPEQREARRIGFQLSELVRATNPKS